MNTDAASRAAEVNEAAFFSAFGLAPGCRLVEVDGALLVDTGELGFARVLTTSVAPAQFPSVLSDCRSGLSAGTRLEWVVGYDYRPADLPDRLKRAGFSLQGTMPAMAVHIADLPDWRTRGPAGLEFERIRTAGDFESRFVPVLAAHFGTGSSFLAALVGAYLASGFSEDSAFLHLVGSVGGGPVEVVGTAWVAGGAIGLGAIATLAASRGRGLGSAMTIALATSERSADVEISVLHATRMGRPVYERLGYRSLFTAEFYRDRAQS